MAHRVPVEVNHEQLRRSREDGDFNNVSLKLCPDTLRMMRRTGDDIVFSVKPERGPVHTVRMNIAQVEASIIDSTVERVIASDPGALDVRAVNTFMGDGVQRTLLDLVQFGQAQCKAGRYERAPERAIRYEQAARVIRSCEAGASAPNGDSE